MSTGGPSPAVRLRDIRCEVAGVTILQVDRLVVAGGERVVLIGSNGAGKSTLLRLLGGLHRPSQGHVEVLQRVLDRRMRPRDLRHLRCEIGQVFQGLHLVTQLTALENVALGALGRLVGPKDIVGSWFHRWTPDVLAASRDALDATGVPHIADVTVRQLSGGERQKVAIARMLLQRPRLVLADEPTANLDPAGTRVFGALLAGLPADVTTFSVVHDTALVTSLGMRAIGLKDGRIAFDLPAAEVDDTRLASLYR